MLEQLGNTVLLGNGGLLVLAKLDHVGMRSVKALAKVGLFPYVTDLGVLQSSDMIAFLQVNLPDVLVLVGDEELKQRLVRKNPERLPHWVCGESSYLFCWFLGSQQSELGFWTICGVSRLAESLHMSSSHPGCKSQRFYRRTTERSEIL